MRLPPPEVLASWPTPNYTNPQKQGPTLLIVELTTLSIALICLVLRLYSRKMRYNKLALDDWLMIAAAPFGIGVTTCVVLAFVRYGWNIHVWDLTFDKIASGRKVSFAAQALFVPATALAKLSILTSYLRFATASLPFKCTIYSAMVFVVALNFTFIFVLFFQCRPLQSYWNLLNSHRDCKSEAATLLSQASTTAVADFVVWAVPIPYFYRMKLAWRKRFLLIALFSFGLFVVIAACFRTYWIHYVVQETYDVTWYGFHLWLWTAVEVHLGIICGCVPWLGSLYRFWRERKNSRRGNHGITSVAELVDTSGRRRGSPGQSGKTAKRGSVVRVASIGSTSTRRGRSWETRWDRARGNWPDLESDSIYSIPATLAPVEPATVLPANMLVPPAHAELRTDRPVGPTNELPPDTPGLAF